MKSWTRIMPFLILAVILGRTWYIIATTDYLAMMRHVFAIVFFAGNLLLYFIRWKYAILLTGVILVLATFNLLAFFPDVMFTAYFVKIGSVKIATPSIDWKSLLLLIFYCIVNGGFLFKLYIDKKRGKDPN
jgi:hypothetical protein